MEEKGRAVVLHKPRVAITKQGVNRNWNHAPFVYTDPDGSHLLRGGFGVLELAETKNIALAMAVSRREAFLSATAVEAHALEMRMLKHPVEGRFANLGDLSALTEEQRWHVIAYLRTLTQSGK